eukprot:71296-Alexandrium_andersonii.AAC.1
MCVVLGSQHWAQPGPLARGFRQSPRSKSAMYSANSLKPRAARGQLWADLATEAGFRDPFHLTPE